jgi:hypothetical protein
MLAVVVILFVTVIINKTWTIEFSRKISFLRVEEKSGVTQNNCAMWYLRNLPVKSSKLPGRHLWQADCDQTLVDDASSRFD